MKNSRVTFIALTLLAFLVAAGLFRFQGSQAQTAVVTTIPGKFYKLDVMATNTSLGIASLFPGPSINDNGVVAFSGTNNLFTADGINPVRTIRSGSFYDGAVQINNNNLLIARSVVASASQQFLSRFDTAQQNSPVTIIAGVNGVGFSDFSDISTFSIGMNNSGQNVFSATALNNTDRQLVTGIRTTFNRQNLSTTTLSIRPMIADNGNVVVRAGNTNTSPIRLYNYALTTPVEIANSTNFTALGQSPGISDNGEVIVFYGNLNATGATALQTNAGPGIFASIVDGTTRRIIRIAGRQVENSNVAPALLGNLDGICDSGEQCIAGELGFTTSGAATTPITFASFNADSRIGVVHRAEGAAGIADDTFIVTFLGTPSSASSAPQYFSNQLGLWAIRVEMKTEGGNLREKPFRANHVIQVGDNLGTPTRQVTGISIYDPIALAATDDQGVPRTQRKPDHRLVFQATTNDGGTTGSAIVRASSFDSDEDGLADHWERSGIDFNQDGTIDLALNNLLPGDPAGAGANPNRKDIFLEMDYMQETGGSMPHTHQPGRRPDNSANLTVDPMLRVRNAFRNAPNRNPDGSNGIILHDFVGEALAETNAIQFLYQNRPTGATDDFDDYKFGSNGTTVGVPCGTGANDGHFGTAADRGSTNCSNILGAKRLVFRYSIFAHRVTFPPDPLDFTSGVAELYGNDFIVSLAVREPGNDWEDHANNLVTSFNSTTPRPTTAFTFDTVFADIQAGTLMHEFGHTLGLYHGGRDSINCKPNYLSIMSYSRQIIRAGQSTINLPGVAPNQTVLSNRKLDFSRGPALRTLNEAALLETAGINGPSGERTLHARQTDGATLISAADSQIDWNNNATNEPTAIPADINRMVEVGGCPAGANQTLVSSDDWNNLRLNFLETINFADGTNRAALSGVEEIDAIDALNGGLGSRDVENDGVLNENDNCIFAPNSDQADSNGNGTGNACDPATTALADLSLSIAESVDPAQINTPFNYIATVSNNGAAAAQNVTFTDQLPANATFVSTTPSQGSCSGTSNIVCNLGTLNANTNATVTIRVTPTALGRLDNYVNVSSGVNDPNILNNKNAASTAITNPSITYTISGRVSNENDMGLGSVAIMLNDSQVTVTDGNGNYSINVAAGGIYTLTAIRNDHDFSASGRTVAYINANETVNLVGVRTLEPTAAEVSISGKVMTPSSGDINNATVKLIDGNGTSRTVSTDASGNYQFTNVLAGQTCIITVTHSYFSFESKVVNVMEEISDLDFIAVGSATNASDLVVWRMQDGVWYVRDAQNQSSPTYTQWGMAGDKPTPADFNGDGLYDFCIFRPNSPSAGQGTWWIQYNGSTTMMSYQFGTDTDVPVPADFDGDGKADVAVWRSTTSSFYILNSSNNAYWTQTVAQSGEPVPVDFDGDGKADAATFNRSTAVWSIIQSSNNTVRTVQFGAANDDPVKGDFDGDGKFDLAVRRGSNGSWHILESSTNQTMAAVQWGYGTDTLVPGDYDADGKTDIAVWRPENGYWFILQSSKRGQPDEMRVEQWGISTDIPVPAAFRR